MSGSESETDDGAAAWDEDLGPDPGLEGEVLAGRYKIVRRLGQGGMATVYVGEHVDIGRRCAVKVLSPAYAGDPEAVERFLREARAASKIRHPNIIEITDFGRAGGTVFFVMELLEGEDLLARIERTGRLVWPEARDVFLQICGALAAAHARGIVHRDLKPENCFCTPRPDGGTLVKVLDFGIAKVNTSTLQGPALTQMGRVFGTPAYMSPEQADGAPADLRSDVYSLGVTMYHALTGRLPFEADTAMGYLKQHMFSAPRALRAVAPEAGILPEVEAIVLKALQKDPALRFQAMDEVAAAILAVGTGKAAVQVVAEALPEPPSFVGRVMGFQAEASAGRRRGPLLAAGAAGVLVVLVAVWWGARGDPAPVAGQAEAVRAPEPAPTPTQAPAPAPALTVVVTLRSNVAARVTDRGAPLGSTADPGGIVLPRGSAERELVLSADGYEDEVVRVVPDRDVELNVVLRRTAAKKKRGGKTGEKAASGEPSLAPINPFKKTPR